jgi:hypothetical protein
MGEKKEEGTPLLTSNDEVYDPQNNFGLCCERTAASPDLRRIEYTKLQEEARKQVVKSLNVEIPVVYESLLVDWGTEQWDVPCHLFYMHPEQGFVAGYEYRKGLWVALIKAYVAWFSIPEKEIHLVWRQIIHCFLKTNFEVAATDTFKAWAYGCMCKWELKRHDMSGVRGAKRRHTQLGDWRQLSSPAECMRGPDSLETKRSHTNRSHTSPQAHPWFAIP